MTKPVDGGGLGGDGLLIEASPAIDSMCLKLQYLSLCKDYADKVFFLFLACFFPS